MPVVSYLPAEILDYIETHAPPEDESFGISQRELAKALGYHPCSMSRPLAQLLGKGMLRSHRGQVRGGIRRQLVYSLTESGRQSLERQTKEAPLLSGALPPPPNPFFGRRHELRELMAYSEAAGGVIFVEGPAGVGKTALISRHVRRLKGARVPFWFSVRAGSSPRHFALALSRGLSTLGAQQLAYYSQLPRAPLGREVADLAARALGDRPLVLVVDDVQMGSPEMKKFFEDFVAGLSVGRHDIFVFVGQNPPFFAPDALPTNHVVLGGLDRQAAHELTDRRGGLAERFESVYQASMGSPLLLQLAVSTPGVDATAAALPAAVIDRLPRNEVVGLLPVALANEPLPVSFLLKTGPMTNERLTQMIQSGLLQRSIEGRVELLQVVRTALIQRIVPSEERAAHLRLAAYYSRSRRPESVRERFLHLVAGESWKLGGHLLMNQERTLLALGYSDGLRNSLRHLTLAMPKGQGRVRALRAEAALLRLHSEYSEAILSLRRAIVESEHDPRIEAECLYQITELHVRMRQLDEADRTLAEARSRAPPVHRLDAYELLSQARLTEGKGDMVRAQNEYKVAYQYSKRWRVTDLSLESLAAWSRLATMGVEYGAALKMIGDGLADARQSGRMDVVFNLLLVRSRAFAELGQHDRAEAEMRTIRSEAEALGYLNQLTYTLSGLAAMASAGHRWADAMAYARQASSLAERLGNDVVLGHTLAIMGNMAMHQGMIEDAIHHGERSVSILSRLPPSDSLAFAIGYLAEIYWEAGRQAEARRLYDEAIRLAETMGMTLWKDSLLAELRSKGAIDASGEATA